MSVTTLTYPIKPCESFKEIKFSIFGCKAYGVNYNNEETLILCATQESLFLEWSPQKRDKLAKNYPLDHQDLEYLNYKFSGFVSRIIGV